MTNISQDQRCVMDKAELVSVRRESQLQPGYLNPSEALYEQVQNDESNKLDFVVTVEFVQETDRGSISYSSRHEPLAAVRSNEGHLSSGLARNQQNLKGKTSLSVGDPKEKRQGIEYYLREQNKDTDPEALAPHKKPFYQRTWFACVTYGSLLLLLIAAILALSCNRTIVIPNAILEGQIVPSIAADLSSISEAATVQTILVDDATSIDHLNPTMDLSNNGPSLVPVDTTTAQPVRRNSAPSGLVQLPESVAQLTAEGTPATVSTPMARSVQDLPEPVIRLLADPSSQQIVSSTQVPLSQGSVPRQEPSPQQPVNSWWTVFALPGPLQSSSSSYNVS